MSFLDTTQIHSPGWRKVSDTYYENTVSSRITVQIFKTVTGEWEVNAAVEPGTIAGDDMIEAARLVMEGRRLCGHPKAQEVIER